MNFNLREFDQLVRGRRSVFPAHYTGAAIREEIIREIITHATWAPTHKRTEPWRFTVFLNEGISRLAEMQAACYRNVTEADGTFREERYKGLQTKPLQSACIIAIGMKRDEKKSVPEVEEIGAVFCAIENLYLSAAAHGLGGYLSTGGVTYFEEAKSLFGLGPEDRLIGFFHLGVPKEWPLPKDRKPLEEVTRWVTQ
ncbi:MAG: nitroreductase [Cyclobacteriaceae bacterium]|nr:nitroreductase [Cyclobacteriaceae bacterium]